LALNGLLVFVGFLGVWLACETLKTLKKQTIATRMAAKAAWKSADIAKRNTDIFVSKERARVGIDSVQPHFIDGIRRRNDPFLLDSDCIEFKVVCYGATSATVLSSYTQVAVSQSPEFTEMRGATSAMSIPRVLSHNDRFNLSETILPEVDDIIADAARSQKATPHLHFRAVINYTDLFQQNTQWQIESRYIWKVILSGGEILSWREEYHQDNERETERPN
jgi:hypothetical protein